MVAKGTKSGAAAAAFVLRFFEMVFAIVAFTTVLDYDASSRIKFLMFTGISGFIIALIFTIAYAAGVGAARGIVAMVLDLIWAIFWVVAASCATSVLKDYSDVADSKLKAGVAFSWLAWVLWYISFNLSLRDWRACKPCPAATGTGPPGSAPNSPANTV